MEFSEDGRRAREKNWHSNEPSWGNENKHIWEQRVESESQDASVHCSGGANDDVQV